MSLRFRKVEINVLTEDGPFGKTLEFRDGLNVIRGDNTIGKSTCILAILYGLGLEGMLSPKHRVPFPEAVTNRLVFEERPHQVLSSEVRLVAENGDGQQLTLRRVITGTPVERQIVTVTEGQQEKAYFVRISGAAQNEAGFHTRLAEFVALRLPLVPRYQGPPVPLYLEAIFPFFFVEQLSGWRAIETRMPTHYGIESLWREAIRFVLGVSGAGNANREFEIQTRCRSLQRQWQQTIDRAMLAASQLQFELGPLPEDPGAFELKATEVESSAERTDLDSSLEELRGRLQTMLEEQIPTIRSTESALSRQLEGLEQEKSELERRGEEIDEAISYYRVAIDSGAARIAELEEDLTKYRDIARLRKRGAKVDSLQHLVDLNHCPTCNQTVDGTLLRPSAEVKPMTTDANREAVRNRLQLYQVSQEQNLGRLGAARSMRAAVQRRLKDVRGGIREIRRDLVSFVDAPSAQAIRTRVILEERIDDLESLREDLEVWQKTLEAIGDEFLDLIRELKELERLRNRSTRGEKKTIALLEDSFLQQLEAYGYRSHQLGEIEISADSYRPTRRDVDLGGMSASDSVRVIWAYLVALLEVSRTRGTNHLGLLIFDEPQQQQVADMSFQALLERLEPTGSYGEQVIFATSENRTDLLPVLTENTNLIELGSEFVIQPRA